MSTIETSQIRAAQALLFAHGESVSVPDMADWLAVDEEQAEAILQALCTQLTADETSGLMVRCLEDRYTLTTKPEVKPWLERLFEPKRLPNLSPAAYEALAVVAYNQPVTRSQIEAVRGVNSDNVVARLQDRGLIRIAGYLDAPGKPALFETTERFLLETGLTSLDELEPLEMMMYDTLQDMERCVSEQLTPHSEAAKDHAADTPVQRS